MSYGNNLNLGDLLTVAEVGLIGFAVYQFLTLGEKVVDELKDVAKEAIDQTTKFVGGVTKAEDFNTVSYWEDKVITDEKGTITGISPPPIAETIGAAFGIATNPVKLVVNLTNQLDYQQPEYGPKDIGSLVYNAYNTAPSLKDTLLGFGNTDSVPVKGMTLMDAKTTPLENAFAGLLHQITGSKSPSSQLI